MIGWLVVAVGAAALAAGLLVGGPAHRRRRIGASAGVAGLGLFPAWLQVWLTPVAGAPPLRRRALLSAPAAAAACLALGSLTHADAVIMVPVAVVLTALGSVTLGRLESTESRRTTARMVADLPQVWDLLAACLAAGLPLRVALSEVVAVQDGTLAELLGEVLTRIRLGEPEAAAWRSAADHPLLGQACRDLARSVASGTSVVELLNEYANQAREDQHAAAEAAAKAIGVRAVLPLMVCFLPAFFLIGIVPIIAGALLPLISGW